MRLKNLIVHGFKSFAHLTSIEFSPGLNVVVGPNGSGKSNVVDALRWVLGDHYREVRVSQNREVIFHGSPAARPLGMAFIETEWNDQAGDQFTISRKIFSSSESEYAFNRRRLRLKELKDLVYEKGFPGETIGVNVVDNTKLQTLFDYRPGERYRLFEMSSGLYGVRQKLLRLGSQADRMAEKLERLRERTAEIELQEKRVKRLAQEEENFLELIRETRELKRFFLDQSVAERVQAVERLDREISTIDGQIEETEANLIQVTENRQRTREQLEKSLKDEHAVTEKIARLKEDQQSIERELYGLVTRARQRSWAIHESRAVLEQSTEESFRLEKRGNGIARILEDSLPLEQEMAALQAERDEARENERRASEELFKMQESYSVATGLYQQNQNERGYLEEEIADLEKERSSTRQRLIQDSEKLVFLQRQHSEGVSRQKLIAQKKTRVSQLVERIEKKAAGYLKAGTIGEDWRILTKVMSDAGWSGKTIYALGWLMREKEICPEGFSWDEGEAMGSGRMVVQRNLLPPSKGWKIVPLEQIRRLFEKGQYPDDNLVSPGGELVYLKSGFLSFPRKILFKERGDRFFRSLTRKKESWRLKSRSLETALLEAERHLADLDRHLLIQDNEIERRQERIEFLELELEKKRARLERLINRQRELNETRLAGKEQIEAGENRVLSWREQEQQLESLLAQKERQRGRWEETRREKERLRVEIEHLKKQAGQAVRAIDSVSAGIRSSQQDYRELADRLSGNRALLVRSEEVLWKIKQQSRTLDAQCNRLSHHCQRIREQEETATKRKDKAFFAREKAQYELDEYTRRLEELGPFAGPPSDRFADWDLKKLEQSIRERETRMHHWNVRRGAIEEYAELKERGDILRTKLMEFDQGMSRFRKDYAQCDREIRERFLQYVKKVNTLFVGFFSRIFEGGEAGIALTGDGLEISIRMPGKKKQSLSLLSSGEKALCGLCLFLSLFRAGSFLFCFFDEVDANLDHFNSNRLAELLQEYARDCQVVIVTHQEEIMEAADRIIGVTMSEPGVSQVVPLEGAHEMERLEVGHG